MKTFAILTQDNSFREIDIDNPDHVIAPDGTEGITQERFYYEKYREDAIKYIEPGGNEIIVRESYFDRVKTEGHDIRIDFTVSRARKIKGNTKSKMETTTPSNGSTVTKKFDPTSLDISSRKLRDMEFDPRLKIPIQTGTYFDEFCSRKGGIMPGTNIMVTGDPGVGKSSNLMDIQTNVNRNQPERKVLYVSGEMKPIDVDEFREFYPGLEDADFFYVGDYLVNPDNDIPVWQALTAVLHKGWDLVILDSFVEVQATCSDELGLTGKKSEKWLLDLMATHNQGYNERNVYTAFLAIQQMNKSGNYVGSKRLEHMTDAFLQLKWCQEEKGRRYMEFSKNRKGQEKIRLYYAFGDGDGIQYAEARHKKEMKAFEIQASAGFTDAEELQEDEMFKLFDELERERLEAQEAA